MQSKAQSLIESCVQYTIGYAVAMAAQLILYPYYGLAVSIGDQAELALWFTAISIGRSYCVRRLFNRLHR